MRAASDALGAGDAEPLVALFDADTVWRGVERGHLWWKRAPS
jgi:ketosteroid isomerase-like protein